MLGLPCSYSFEMCNYVPFRNRFEMPGSLMVHHSLERLLDFAVKSPIPTISYMKFLTWFLIFTVVSLGVTGLAADADKEKGKGKLRHVVAFKFKDTATPDDIKKVQEAFKALKTKIPQITKFEAGKNNSPESLDKGCNYGWILSFNSEKDRDAYLVHPDHKAFGTLVKPYLADVFVIDFWSKD
jgi:hypothetical protein